jgi:hypothetical protein
MLYFSLTFADSFHCREKALAGREEVPLTPNYYKLVAAWTLSEAHLLKKATGV